MGKKNIHVTVGWLILLSFAGGKCFICRKQFLFLFCFVLLCFLFFLCGGTGWGGVGRDVDWNWGSQCLNN